MQGRLFDKPIRELKILRRELGDAVIEKMY